MFFEVTKLKLEKEGNKTKMTVFEKVMNELKNMEHCIEHYIQVAMQHAKTKYSAIEKNESQHIKQDSFNNIQTLPKSLTRAVSHQVSNKKFYGEPRRKPSNFG